jgi:hypothetical protein
MGGGGKSRFNTPECVLQRTHEGNVGRSALFGVVLEMMTSMESFVYENYVIQRLN